MSIFKKFIKDLFGETRGRYEKILNTNKPLICAFVIETNPDSSISIASRVILIPASKKELKEKIRQQFDCSDNTEVIFIPPSDWEPPHVRIASQQEIRLHFQEILLCIARFLIRNGRTDINADELMSKGNIMTNPVSGEIIFTYYIEPKGG